MVIFQCEEKWKCSFLWFGCFTPRLVNSGNMSGGQSATLLSLSEEVLGLIIDHLFLCDINSLRLVCKRLKATVEMQTTLRCNQKKLDWQLSPAPLMGLRRHFVRKLAESFVTNMSEGRIEKVMEVWAVRMELQAFLEASCQEDYTMAISQLIYARHQKLVKRSLVHICHNHHNRWLCIKFSQV